MSPLPTETLLGKQERVSDLKIPFCLHDEISQTVSEAAAGLFSLLQSVSWRKKLKNKDTTILYSVTGSRSGMQNPELNKLF